MLRRKPDLGPELQKLLLGESFGRLAALGLQLRGPREYTLQRRAVERRR
jgi:hypothetical protein